MCQKMFTGKWEPNQIANNMIKVEVSSWENLPKHALGLVGLVH